MKVLSPAGVREMDVEGMRVGDWMAHRIPELSRSPSPSPGHGWRVAHICGAAIMTLVDHLMRADAVRIAKALDAALTDFPSEIAPSEILYWRWIQEWQYVAEAVVAEALGVTP